MCMLMEKNIVLYECMNLIFHIHIYITLTILFPPPPADYHKNLMKKIYQYIKYLNSIKTYKKRSIYYSYKNMPFSLVII